MILAWVGLVGAATVAVLPLEQGPTSQEHAGLGGPLAGMLVADLMQVEGLTLVERSQLDALLAEIELSGSGYLDPSTAVEAGRLSGAEQVVIGSYSVVDGLFLLEARRVEVASGEVLEAGSVSGPVQDFVSVEKALVRELVPELGGEWSAVVAEQVELQAPTASFDAFAAYGLGLSQSQAGQVDQAAASWSRAVELDPSYGDARAALVALRLDVSARQTARTEAAVSDWEAARRAVIATVPPPLGRRFDAQALAHHGVRWTAMKQLDAHCDRYDEMVAYLQDHGLPQPPSNAQDQALQASTVDLWVEWGLVDSRVKAERAAWQTSPMLWRSGTHFLFDLSGWLTDDDIADGDGLMGSLRACFAPDQRLAEVERVRELVADTPQPFDNKELSLDQALQLHAAFTAADAGQLDAERSAGLAELADAVAGDPKLAKWVDARIDDVLRAADRQERRLAARLGLSDEVLWGLTAAVAAQDPAVLVVDTVTCQEVLRQKQPLAAGRVQARAEGRLELDDADLLWTVVASARDFGCVRGVPATLTSAAQVYERIQTAPTRARLEHVDACAPRFQDMAERYDPSGLVMESSFEGMDAMQAIVAHDDYVRELVLPLCVVD